MIWLQTVLAVSVLIGAQNAAANCVCGPNGEFCQDLLDTWVREFNGRYWAYVSPCAEGCSQIIPLPYLGWRRATAEEWLLAPLNFNYWCVYDGNGNNPEFSMNNGNVCRRGSGQFFCSAFLFDPRHNHCDPGNPWDRTGESRSWWETMLVHGECDEIVDRPPGCVDFFWSSNDPGVEIPDGCDFTVGVTPQVCLDRDYQIKCPASCGYCESDASYQERLLDDPDAEVAFCAEIETYTTTELTGATTGGEPILISSPCFTDAHNMALACQFGSTLVEATVEDDHTFRCTVPTKRLSASPLVVSFRVRLGRMWFLETKQFRYTEACVPISAGAENSEPVYVSVGQMYELSWDPDLYGGPNERLLIVQRRFFSGGAMKNDGIQVLYETDNRGQASFEITAPYGQDTGFREVVQTSFFVMNWPCQSWIDKYGFPDSFPNVHAVGGRRRLFHVDGLPDWQNNIKCAWADHPDIGSMALAEALYLRWQEARGLLEGLAGNPLYTTGETGSAQAVMYCFLGCKVGFHHFGDVAQAMKVQFLKFQPCHLRGIIEKNLDVGIHVCINQGGTRKNPPAACELNGVDEDEGICNIYCDGTFLPAGKLCHRDTMEHGGQYTNVLPKVKPKCLENSTNLIAAGFTVAPAQCTVLTDSPLVGCGTSSPPTAAPTAVTVSPTKAPSAITANPTSVTQSPTDSTSAPSSATSNPTSLTQSPTDGTNAPSAITANPTSVTQSPTDGTNAPTDSTPSPTTSAPSPAPTSDTPSPTDSTNSPTDSTPNPTDITGSPTDSTNSPTDGTASPTDSTGSPTDSTSSPTDGTNAPTDSTGSPTDSTNAPTDNTPSPTTPPPSPTPGPTLVPTPSGVPSCYDPVTHECVCPGTVPNNDGTDCLGDPHYRSFDRTKLPGWTHHCQGNGVFWALRSQVGGINPVDLGFSGQLLIKKPSLSARYSIARGQSWKKDNFPAISIEYLGGWVTHYGDESYNIADSADLARLNADAAYFQVMFVGNKATILTNWGVESHSTTGSYVLKPACNLRGVPMVGLFGTYDGDPDNDVVNMDGTFEATPYLGGIPDYASSDAWCAQYKVPCSESHFPQYSQRNLDNLLYDYCVDDVAPGRRRVRRLAKEFTDDRRRLQAEGEEFDWDSDQFSEECKQIAFDLCGGPYPGILGGACWQDMLLTDCADVDLPNELVAQNDVARDVLDANEAEFDCGNVCQNGGICIRNEDPDADEGSGVCMCVDDYEGFYCEQAPAVEFDDTPRPSASPFFVPNPPTGSPTKEPTVEPTPAPTDSPTESPTKEPTLEPTDSPTESPTKSPTKNPTESPTLSPTKNPTESPTLSPTLSPTCWEDCSAELCGFDLSSSSSSSSKSASGSGSGSGSDSGRRRRRLKGGKKSKESKESKASQESNRSPESLSADGSGGSRSKSGSISFSSVKTDSPTATPIPCSASVIDNEILVDPMGCSDWACGQVFCHNCGDQGTCNSQCKAWTKAHGLDKCWYFKGDWCSKQCKSVESKFKCWQNCEGTYECPPQPDSSSSKSGSGSDSG